MRMRSPRHARIIRRAAASVVAFASLGTARVVLAQGCAMCGGSIGDGRLVQAFNTSILFMMGAPYLIFAVAGGWIFYKYRAAESRRAAVIKLDPTGQRAASPVVGEPEGDTP